MKKLKLWWPSILATIILSALLSCSSVFAQDISSTNQAEGTITIPLTQWNELKVNNAKALSLIETSSIPLTEVQSLTANQAKELTALKSINEQQLSELTKAKSDLQTQKSYLNATNEYLTQLKADLKRNRATERRLERQRNTWAVVAGGILVAGILK